MTISVCISNRFRLEIYFGHPGFANQLLTEPVHEVFDMEEIEGNRSDPGGRNAGEGQRRAATA
jgi:hypothetical protein